jgi:hypothetical protein
MTSSPRISLTFGLILLAGCGGAQTAAIPLSASANAPSASRASHAISWMAKGLQQRDLLYVSNANGTVSVYRYWQQTLVGVLTKFQRPMGECADPAGNVYVADDESKKVDTYRHGSTKMLKAYDDAPYTPYGCAFSPSTGSLALANYGTKDYSYYGDGNIAIYQHASGSATIYGGSSDNHFTACAYDGHGDLLAVSETGYSGHWYYSPEFFYLPKDGKQLVPVTLPNPYSSSGWYYQDVQGLAWDGKYWIVDSYNELYRYTINIKAQLVDRIALSGGDDNPGPVWIYRKNFKGAGTEAVAASSANSGKGIVDYWKYPAAGSPVDEITSDLDSPFGVAVSFGTEGAK